MAEEPIRGEQIIQPDWAANATKSANELDAAIQKLIAHTGVLAKSNLANFTNNDPKTTDDINAQTKAVEQNTKIEKQNIEAKILAAQVNKRIKDEIQATLSSYSRLSLEYRKAAQAAKDLAAADILQGKAFSETTKEAINKATGLNNQLKSIDQSMGNYQRNVGNYHGAVKNLARGLSGLTGLTELAGKALGVNEEALNNLTTATKTLTTFAKDLSHAKHLETVATEENTIVTEVNTTATTQATTATGLYGVALTAVTAIAEFFGVSMAAAWAIATAGISVLIVGVIGLVAWLKNQSDATQLLIEKEKLLQQGRDARSIKRDAEQQKEIDNAQFRIDRAKKEGKSKEEILRLENELLDIKIAQNAEDEKKYRHENTIDGLKKYQEIKVEENKLQNEKILLNIKEIDTIKTKNKEVKENIDLEGKLLDILKASTEEQNNRLKALKRNEPKYEIEFAQIHKLTTEYDRLNKTKAGLIGGKSGSPVASTDTELENDRKKNEQKINEAKKLSDQLFKIAEDRIKREQELNKQNIDEIDKGIDQQLQLLIAGQKNTYDFMLRQKAKALEEQAALDKKARKEKEAQQIAELFLEFMKVNAKDGFGAAAKSLAETLLAKGLAGGLSGYYEGTEDTGTGGGLDSKGGMLAVLHPHERVLTAKQNAAIGAISNEDLVKSVMRYKIPAEKNSTVIDLQNSILISELKELNNTIKNKKELEVNWNRLNEIILTNKQNGYTVETTFKNSPIIKRDSPFKGGRA